MSSGLQTKCKTSHLVGSRSVPPPDEGQADLSLHFLVSVLFFLTVFPWLLHVIFGYPPSKIASIPIWAGWFTFVQFYLTKTIHVKYPWHLWFVAILSTCLFHILWTDIIKCNNFRNKAFMLIEIWAISVDHSFPETASNTFKKESSYFFMKCIYKKQTLK